MEYVMNFVEQTGFYTLINGFIDGGWKYLLMIAVSLLLLYLAIKKQFEPLLLIGIAFGMLLTNLPGANMYHGESVMVQLCTMVVYSIFFISALRPVCILALSL